MVCALRTEIDVRRRMAGITPHHDVPTKQDASEMQSRNYGKEVNPKAHQLHMDLGYY